MNLGACGGLPLSSENWVWYRAVQLAYLSTALSSAHTTTSRTRFNPGALLPPAQRFQILYFAEDPLTATFEFGAMLGNPFAPGGSVAHPAPAFAMLNVQVTLSQVADLTAQAQLQTTAQELTGDWDGYQVRGPATPVSLPVGQAPTQELGHALFQISAPAQHVQSYHGGHGARGGRSLDQRRAPFETAALS